MSDEKKPFVVNDRRHFTPEGEARSAQETPEAGRWPERAGGAAVVSQAEPRPEARRGPGPAPVDFAGFLLSLAAQGGTLLSSGREPGEGAAPDLDGVQQIIAVLEMLKDKTEGRRTPDEDTILEGILYELRMGYLERTRAGGA